ncbi:MAG: photosynthetic reaction center cytochrome c subunit [Fimbriimonadaceae bacterium]|nr:photosynthetic reaction center cytochrome c subunit [Fimbriimonadaceae bacterium]
MRRYARIAILAVSLVPITLLSAQQSPSSQGPMCEEVYANIKVFKGVPASDLIPAMEFMSASLGFQCSSCHDPKDYSAESPIKETARKMVTMQRDINTRYFDGKLEVTCMSCHNGKEHPAGAPIPAAISLRHERMENAPKPADLFAKHMGAVGTSATAIVRTGTLTAPNDATHKIETMPLEMIHAEGGKFRLISGERKVNSDGKQIWYNTFPMTDEPAAIFGRIGRTWQDEGLFSELTRTTVVGKDKVGKTEVVVVRSTRPSTASTEELYFDSKSGLLVRMVNIKRSTIGSVITVIDYSNYKNVGSAKLPMKIVVTFAGNESWTMDFKSAKTDSKIEDSIFGSGGG